MVDINPLYWRRLHKKWSKLDKSAKIIAHAAYTESEPKLEGEMLHELVRIIGASSEKRQEEFINFISELGSNKKTKIKDTFYN